MTTETGNPTELCLRLRKRIGKPHIWLFTRIDGRSYVRSSSLRPDYSWNYCGNVTPGSYKSPGDAARAWHNYKAPGA